MLNEIDCKRKDRVLPIFATILEKQLPTLDEIDKFTKGRIGTQAIQEYLKWEKQGNQIITYNGHGYCDTKVPKSYSFLIDLEDPNHGVEVECILEHAIYNGIVPLNTIKHGHHTYCVITFPNGVPVRLNTLETIEKTEFKFRFGLCNKNDKDLIIDARKLLKS